MYQSKLHLILVNDSTLLPNTVDVLQEHFAPDMGINIGFLESFDLEGDTTKIKNATKQCFALLRATKMWAFVDELVELGCGIHHSATGLCISSTLKKILLDLELQEDTTLLIHGTLADSALAMSILTDAKLNGMYALELSNYSTVYNSYNVPSFNLVNV